MSVVPKRERRARSSEYESRNSLRNSLGRNSASFQRESRRNGFAIPAFACDLFSRTTAINERSNRVIVGEENKEETVLLSVCPFVRPVAWKLNSLVSMRHTYLSEPGH